MPEQAKVVFAVAHDGPAFRGRAETGIDAVVLKLLRHDRADGVEHRNRLDYRSEWLAVLLPHTGSVPGVTGLLHQFVAPGLVEMTDAVFVRRGADRVDIRFQGAEARERVVFRLAGAGIGGIDQLLA